MKKGDALSLSKGWEIRKLGEVCTTGAGGTPLKAHKDYYDGGTIPWLMSGEVSQGEIFESSNFITEKGLKNSSARLFPPNTVLVAMYGATAGQVGILRFEAATNQAVCGILPNEKTIPEFLFYCFLSKKDELISQAAGNAQPNISQIKIKNTLIPVPTIPDQQRIVSILNEAFAALEQAKENVQCNLQNAKELFQSELNNIFTKKGEGWVEKKLGEVCKTGAGGTPLKQHKDYYEGGKIPWLRSGEVCKKDILESELFITVKGMNNSSARLFPIDTVIIAMYGATAGQVGILKFEATTNQAVCGILPNDKFIPEFLYYVFLSKKEELVSQATGNAQPNISQIKIKETIVPLIDIKEQKKIVTQLNTLSAETKKLESMYQQKLNSLEELKKSILQKAFSGELKTAIKEISV